jgi:acylphosphatase
VPTARFTVRGRVQGVGFRYFVRTAGRSLGIRGWVRNAADGSVELVASAADAALTRLEARLRTGPPGSAVSSVACERVPDDDTLPHPFVILR